MTGRPPTPISTKRANGDTRKLGAMMFQESLFGTWEPRRGRPKFPAGLRFRPIAGEGASVASARKSRLALARAHWKSVADQLEAEGKLFLVDEGVLTGLAMSYALMIETGQEGDVKLYKEVSQRYMQLTDRMGLNESARVRIPGSGREPSKDPLMGAMCG
ncbi:MAG TPA: hypothetical protein VNT29_07725 [Candidatus Limnocylindrales bacterium]|nr:hypothetical protein [Candidatus Limnocylindrales bacterium]